MIVTIELEALMEKRGMSVDDLASKINMTRQTIYNLRGNRVNWVSLDTLAKICEALSCDPADILVLKRLETVHHS